MKIFFYKNMMGISCALFFGIVVFTVGKSYGQTFNYDTREISEHKEAGYLIGSVKPVTLFTVTEVNYPSSVNSSNHVYKSIHLFVKVYVNHEYDSIIQNSYTYKIQYEFKGYNRFQNSQIYSGNLIISYDPDSIATFQDISIDKYSDIFKVENFKVIDIFDISDTSVAPKVVPFQLDSLQKNFIIEATIETQLYDKHTSRFQAALNSSYTAHPDKNYLAASWNISGSTGVFQTSPANFELEWTYIDNYGTVDDLSDIPAKNLSYNFRNNSTRVWLETNSYKIPVIYEKGYIVFRVRMVQPDPVHFRYPLYAPWSITADSGALSGLDTSGSTHMYKITASHLGDSLNWQYTTSFAEGGRYKHVLSYYDGLLKNRQTLTRFNADTGSLIVTENIYDYEGRPAIKILPTPVVSSSFKYQQNISTNDTSHVPYKAADFDILNTDTCLVEITPSALKSTALASIYYSSDNSDKSGHNRLIPNANGYPFVQTVYDPVNDKRILVQGGAGAELQVGNKHYTRNEFVGEDQSTLNQLLGVDAGWSNFYRKTVVTDPNGQVSMSVVDYKNRPVTSAMLGTGPDSTSHAIKTNDNVPAMAYLEQELLKYHKQETLDHTKTLNKHFYVDFDGNADLKYKYIFRPYKIPWCPSYGLSVAADYFYYAADACGEIITSAADTIGQSVPVSPIAPLIDTALNPTFFKKGKHYLYKQVSIRPESIQTSVDSFIELHPSCIYSKDYFIRDEFKNRELPCPQETTNPCDEKKRQMMADLYPGTGKYGNYGYDSLARINGAHSIFTLEEGGGYRYQNACLGTAMTVTYTNGTYYNHPFGAKPERFMNAFNDSIAEFLLPLHPEYCKLQGCWVDTFQDVLQSLPNGEVAASQNLLTLQDVIAADPLRARIQLPPLNISSADVDSLLATVHNGLCIDSMVLPLVYCNCNDTTLYKNCREQIFKNEIENGILSNPTVRDAYFENMMPMYMANRRRLIDAMLSGNGDTCEPCRDTTLYKVANKRISVIKQPAVFDNTWGADLTSLDTNGILYQLGTDTTITSTLDFIQRMLKMSKDSLLAFSDSAHTIYNQHNLNACTGQVEHIVARFANCIKADTTLRNNIKNSLNALCNSGNVIGGNFSAEQIRYALVSNGVSLDDLCNPYLISYGSIAGSQNDKRRFCKRTEFYDYAQSFFNRSEVLTSLTDANGSAYFTVLSSANEFESDLKDSVSSATDTVFLYTAYDAVDKLYALHVFKAGDSTTFYLSGGSNACDTIFNGVGIGETLSFTNIRCVNDINGSIGSSYAGILTFVADVERVNGAITTNCTMLGWADQMEMMSKIDNKLAGTIPCTQMHALYEEFADTLNAYQVKGTDHPSYDYMLPGFMNNKLGHTYTAYQYKTFIQSCALADNMGFSRYEAYSYLKFTDTAAAFNFLEDYYSVDTSVYVFEPYMDIDSTTDSVLMLIDFNTIPYQVLWKYRDFITANTHAQATFVNQRLVDIQNSVTMGCVIAPKYAWDTLNTYISNMSSVRDSLFGYPYGEHFKLNEPVKAYMKFGNVWLVVNKYNVEQINGTGTTHKDRSVAMHNLEQKVYANGWAVSVQRNSQSTVDDDYFKDYKQDFLDYVYSAQGSLVRRVVDSLHEDSLNAHVYTSTAATYNIPTQPGNTTNLFVANTQTALYDSLEMLLNFTADTFQGSIFFPSPDSVSKMFWYNTTHARQHYVFRCSDGNYLYVMFNHGTHTMYYAFVNVPKYLARDVQYDYILDDILPQPGVNESRYFDVVIKHRMDHDKKIKLFGRAGFIIAHNETLEDVLLNNPISATTTYRDTIDNCEQNVLSDIIYVGTERYNRYIDSLRHDLYDSFFVHVIDSVDEEMQLGMVDQKFQITVSMYDRAGNLYKTVPPAGINKISSTQFKNIDSARKHNLTPSNVVPNHFKESTYHYNTQNQLVYQQTPDGGEVFYYYDAVGRLRFSQNDKQKNIWAYTYNLYDKQSRVIETGQVECECTSIPDVVANVITKNDSTINSYVHSLKRQDVVATSYDTSHHKIPITTWGQDNLRKRISAVKYFRQLTPIDTYYRNYDHAAFYSYDIAGNVKGLYHHFPLLDKYQQGFKKIHYDYDLISGKVNLLSYNRGFPDQFYQRYKYDADNRITLVETSQDGIIWLRDAEYAYYKHGPLARMSLGDHRVQGVDYVYTIQGWLKAINSDVMKPGNDAGKDGEPGTNIHAHDAFAMSLQYFQGDYTSIGADTNILRLAEHADENLYNGNISRQVVNINSLPPLAANYAYDQLNRIKRTGYDAVFAGNDSLAAVADYFSAFSYDEDGNLQKLRRRGNGTGSTVGGISYLMDSLTYFYNPTAHNNRLEKITDHAANNYVNDIRYDTTTTVAKYQYDAIGNLIRDMVSMQDTINWNLYNKVTHTENRAAKNSMDFYYDGCGNRFAKVYNQQHDTFYSNTGDYYVRDAQGNILATYKSILEYKYINHLAIHRIDSSVVAIEGGEPFLDFLGNYYAGNNDFATAVTTTVGSNPIWAGGYVELEPVSFYAQNSSAVYSNLLHNGIDYIVPLFEHNSGQVIANAWKQMFANNNSTEIYNWTAALFGDATMPTFLFEKMCDAEPTGEHLMADMLTAYGLSTSSDCAMDAGNVAAAFAGTSTAIALPDLAGYLATAYANGTAEFNTYLELLANSSAIYSNSSYTGIGGTLVPVVQASVDAHGVPEDVYSFMDGWGDAHDYLQATNTMTQLVSVRYYANPLQFLTDYTNEYDFGIIDSALAGIANFSVEMYASLVSGHFIDMEEHVEHQLDYSRKTTLDHYYLAEHHLYGSSRLGVKMYQNNQHFHGYEDKDGVKSTTIYNLTDPKAWYSSVYQDVIFHDSLTPYKSTFTGKETYRHYAGQKGYELTNHLGNVQAVVSENKLPNDTDSDEEVDSYKPSLKAVYDYYPFGMLMPGRYLYDTGIKCNLVVYYTDLLATARVYDTYPQGLIFAPDANSNATPIGTVTTDVITYETLEYYSVSTDEEGAGFEQYVQVDAGEDHSLVLDVQSSGGSYEAVVSQYVDNAWQVVATQPITAAGELTINFHPTVTTVLLQYLRTAENSAMTITLNVRPLLHKEEKVHQWSKEVLICNKFTDHYRFGFNGQEKVNEIAGIGNHNTALFWEYDTRLGRRWNLDPVDQVSISNYAAFENNPIWKNDPLGNIPNEYEKNAVTGDFKLTGTKGGDEKDYLTTVYPPDKTEFGFTIPGFSTTQELPVKKGFKEGAGFGNDTREPGLLLKGTPWSGRADVVDDPFTSIGPGLVYGLGRYMVTKAATKIGAQYSDDLVKTAQKLYPKKAGKTELHHITPKYLGGAKNGPLVPLDASYHQVITNEFRALWPYGKSVPSATELQNIMKQVYSKYPLPPVN